MIHLCFLCRHLIFKWKPDKIEIKTKDGIIHKNLCSDCAIIVDALKEGKVKDSNSDLKQFEERINKHDSI